MSQTKAKKEDGATSSSLKRQTYEETMTAVQAEVSGKFYELFQSVGDVHNRLVNDLDKQRSDFEKLKDEYKRQTRELKEREDEFVLKEQNHFAREKRFEEYEVQREDAMLLEKKLIEDSKKVVSSLEDNLSRRTVELDQLGDVLKGKEDVLKKKEKEHKEKEKNFLQKEKELKEKEKNFLQKKSELKEKQEKISARAGGLDDIEAKLKLAQQDLNNQKKALDEQRKGFLQKEEARTRLEVKEAKCLDAQLSMERERMEMEKKISELDEVLQFNLIELETTKEDLAKRDLDLAKRDLECLELREQLASAPTTTVTGWLPFDFLVRQLREEKADDVQILTMLEKHERKMKVLSRGKEWFVKVDYVHVPISTAGFRYNPTSDPEPFAKGTGDDKFRSFDEMMRNVINKVLERRPMPISTTSSVVGC